jgi:cobalt-zinc-cadmium resistance protein CzcA
VLVALAVVAGAGAIVPHLGTEFLPALDEGDLNVLVELPTSASLESGQDIFLEVRRRLLAFSEVREVDTKQGRPEDGTDNESVNMGETFVHLHARERWRPGMSTEALQDEMRDSLLEIPGVRVSFSQPIRDNVEEAISGVRGSVVLKIYGTDLVQMSTLLLEALEAVREVPGVIEASLYRDRMVPQLEIRPDRERLARAGISMDAVQSTIEIALAGRVAGAVWSQERLVPVRIRLPESERSDTGRIGDLAVAGSEARIPLRSLADIALAPGRSSIARENNSRVLALKFSVEGRDLGSVVRDAMAAVNRTVQLPEGYRLAWGGEFENQERAMRRLAIVVPIALVVVLGLLFVALGNARGALTVLLAIPTSLAGGVLALALAGVHLSVSSMIGFIALLGQVALASLLVLGAIDEKRKEGAPLLDAAISGAVLRFRAVLMTALLAVIGLVPMAVSTGTGSETQRPFALVLIGGLVTTCLVALFVLPALYTWIAPRELPDPRKDDEELES